MAARRSSGEPKLVTLVDPNGGEYKSNSPAEMNQLHFGRGYSFKDHDSFNAAIEFLGDDAAVQSVATPAPSGAPNAAAASSSGS
jgi:hypothetical protein